MGAGSHAISVCNMFSGGQEIAKLVIALGQARTVPLAGDFLSVHHEGNKTDKEEGSETQEGHREGDFQIFFEVFG